MTAGHYRYYMLGVLTVIHAFALVDRAVLSMALQDIKVELDLSDGQLGFLTGLAFALFYAILGLPIARWGDQGNRKNIIALTTAAWSVMVVFCGLAVSYLQLIVARIGVAAGEAGVMPLANSLIPDYFDRSERPRAMSIYLLGGPLSILIGYFLGAWLIAAMGWRLTFVVFGIPGVILGILAYFTLKEPRNKNESFPVVTEDVQLPSTMPAPTEDIPVSEVFRYLWRNRSYTHVVLGFIVMGFLGAGVVMWLPSFFSRSLQMGTVEIGFWMTVCWGAVGALGIYAGGAFTSKFAAGRERYQFKLLAGLMALYAFVCTVTYLSDSKYLTIALIGVASFVISCTLAPLYSAIQSLTRPAMRGQALAVLALFNSLIGLGLGPLVLGILSDALTPRFGGESLRYSLVLTSPFYLWVAIHFWLASRTVEADIRSVSEETDEGPRASTTFAAS